MWRLYFVFVLLPVLGHAQDLEEKLQGTWLCVNVTDSTGNSSHGEFGGARNFLKFQFEEKKLFMALSPFDKGSLYRVVYETGYFDLLNSPHNQTRYKVSLLSNDTLTLETVSNKNIKLIYQFRNSNEYAKDLDKVSNVRDYEKLIIEITHVQDAFGYYMSSYYQIDNSILNRLPSPLFVDKQYFSLGSYLEENLRIPLLQMKELNDKETVFEFDITENGIENISILEKLGDDVDFQIYDLIRGMSKKWQPLMVNGTMIVTRIRFKLSFSYKEK